MHFSLSLNHNGKGTYNRGTGNGTWIDLQQHAVLVGVSGGAELGAHIVSMLQLLERDARHPPLHGRHDDRGTLLPHLHDGRHPPDGACAGNVLQPIRQTPQREDGHI